MRWPGLEENHKFRVDVTTGCTETPAAAKASLARSM
jgi:hypothetical protein